MVDEPGMVDHLGAALRRRVDRVGKFFLLMAADLVIFVVYLSITLPSHKIAVRYDGAWVGFDCGLAAVISWWQLCGPSSSKCRWPPCR